MTQTQTELSIAGHWINGKLAPGGEQRIEVVSPANGAVIATIPSGTAHDVDAAVDAARAALPGWAATTPAERSRIIANLA